MDQKNIQTGESNHLTDTSNRDAYRVLAVVFLKSGFTAIGVILIAMKRLFRSIDEKLISHHECMLGLSILLLTALCLNGFSLLMNSADRLSVVAFPLYYYIHNTRIISYSLIAAQYVITTIAVISIADASLIERTRQIFSLCMLHSVYSPNFYKVILLLACGTSFLRVALMVIAVVILKKYGLKNLLHQFVRDLSHFLTNQRRYTQTAIISCCLTFFLAVVPAFVTYIHMMDSSMTSQFIVICCTHLRMLKFLQYGSITFISSKRFSVCSSSIFQIPILQTKATCSTS